MKDELCPLSGESRNTFGGWAATLVDSLDTLHIMGMHEELQNAIAAVADIDFKTSTDPEVPIFEVNIRYLGGFLSAYDLTGDDILLQKAVEVGEMLLIAFDTPNRLPVLRWSWEAATRGVSQEAPESAVASEIGSFSVEFIRLSQITGDMRWYDAMARINILLHAQQQSTKLPGMWPVGFNARDMIFDQDSLFSLGAMSDSLYEYFPKAYALLAGGESVYRQLYEDSMAIGMQYLFFRPLVPNNDDILFSGVARAGTSSAGTSIKLDSEVQHLACFTGGMLALGSRLFNLPKHLIIGRKLTEGCLWAYNASPSGVMPETFHVVPCKATEACNWDEARWKKAVLERDSGSDNSADADVIIASNHLAPGFTEISDRQYMLRPEAIESVFILYRITGDKTLLEKAWQMWIAISTLAETDIAFATVTDVTAEGPPPHDDRMESFWMAETLKYFYLIFSEPDLISLDDYVFNTEAHPVKRPK